MANQSGLSSPQNMQHDHASQNPQTEEEDILKYLLADSASELSSPDGSPFLVLEDSTNESPDASPWREAPSGADISIYLDTNPEYLLYGSNFDNMDYNSFPMITPAPASTVPMVATSPEAKLIASPCKKASRSKKRPRVSEPPPTPSPEQPEVALPRDTLLQISSQGMERYVENLSSSRALSLDDQKELKRQKRLIKNRESAQLSRERKRAFIDQLQDKINLLVNENTVLKNENTTLRQALSQYQTTPSTVVPKVQDVVYPKQDPQSQHLTKMGGLLSSATTIGGARTSTTAKAGVCLLVVLFTFGLFMNSTNVSPRVIGLLPPKQYEVAPSRAMSVISPNIRSILEVPQVADEEIDDYYESSKKQISHFEAGKVRGADKNKEVMQVQRQIIQHPIQVKDAGIFKVSYSPEPATFLAGETTTKDQEDNSTYMLFLDPRPDLDSHDVEINTPPPSHDLSTSKSSDLQVSPYAKTVVIDPTHRMPPMIISLVVPSHVANGSNPLFPKEGYSSSDSLVEITCQVVDISITTSERRTPQ